MVTALRAELLRPQVGCEREGIGGSRGVWRVVRVSRLPAPSLPGCRLSPLRPFIILLSFIPPLLPPPTPPFTFHPPPSSGCTRNMRVMMCMHGMPPPLSLMACLQLPPG